MGNVTYLITGKRDKLKKERNKRLGEEKDVCKSNSNIKKRINIPTSKR